MHVKKISGQHKKKRTKCGFKTRYESRSTANLFCFSIASAFRHFQLFFTSLFGEEIVVVVVDEYQVPLNELMIQDNFLYYLPISSNSY